MKRKLLVGLLVLGVLVVGAGGGYYYGQHRGYSLGKEDGFTQGRDEGFNAGTVVAQQTADTEEGVSKSDYDALIGKYNDLVRKHNASLNTSISCYSNTYGLDGQFTTTNCY